MPTLLREVKEVTDVGTVETRRVILFGIEWFPSNTGQDLKVSDGNGNLLYKVRSTGPAPNGESAYVEWKSFSDIFVDGIKVDTIDGGTVYISYS